MKIKIKRFDKKIPLPKYEKDAAGFDIFCRENTSLKPKEIKAVRSNIALNLPKDHVLLIVPRSSTPLRKGLDMPNSIGVIDPFYCGDDNENMLLFRNITDKTVYIKKGEKLAQGILVKFEKVEFVEVDKLNKSKRQTWKMKTGKPNR